MQDKLTKIFKNAKYEPNPNLATSVWLVITAREKHLAQFKLWAFASAFFASLAGMIPTFQVLLNNMAHSGFYEYFSLIFSDGGSMFSYWKELILSLAESLPIMSIVFTLSLIFVFFLSLRYLMKQIIKNQLTSFAMLSA
jgi:glucan phosphoethanolaminetransferase (alkaline phosphatase superfamily)